MTNYHTISELDEILSKAKMSPDLRKAVEAIKEAIEKRDKDLVADLTAVKSVIISEIDPDDKTHHFQEDEEYNKEVLGFSLYEYFDSLNFEYTYKKRKMIPAGMIIFENGKIKQRSPSKINHPIIKLMEEERKAIESGNI